VIIPEDVSYQNGKVEDISVTCSWIRKGESKSDKREDLIAEM